MSGLQVYSTGSWTARADHASTVYPRDSYPTAATTGYPHGLPGDTRSPVTLVPYAGPSTISTPGTVIDSCSITGQIWVQAPNVTISNCLITTSESEMVNAIRVDGSGSVLVRDTEVFGEGAGTPATAVGSDNFTLLRVDIHGFGDGVRAGDNVTVRDSFIHDLRELGADPHNDCIQSTGGSHCRFIHNSLENQHAQTACFIFGPSLGNIDDMLVEGNLLAGGGYSVYLGDDTGSGLISTNIAFINNRWSRKFYANGGFHGPHSIVPLTGPLVWRGNVWHDTEEIIGEPL
jgi:hypothetical protein